MTELVAYAEHTWMDRMTDQRMWDQLARAYGATSRLVEEGWEPDLHGTVVVVDQYGLIELELFDHPPDCTYVFGRTNDKSRLLKMVPHYRSLRIDTPAPISLFGVTAAAIVLADRQGKQQ